jgi:hypothetical protein
VKAQTDEGMMVAKILGLDTTISGATAFNDELLKCAPGYTFKFLDKNPGGISEMKYLYEHSNHEILKVEYTYRNKVVDSSGKAKPIVFSQRIIADNQSITTIYNCMFGESLQAGQLEAYSGTNFGFLYQDRGYHYSLMPDDYRPGYWILTFTE